MEGNIAATSATRKVTIEPGPREGVAHTDVYRTMGKGLEKNGYHQIRQKTIAGY